MQIIKQLILSSLIILISGCVRAAPDSPEWIPAANQPSSTAISFLGFTPTASFKLLPTRIPGSPVLTPTPDIAHLAAAEISNPDQYTVVPGDTLGKISRQFSISIESLMEANNLNDPNSLFVGQILTIPKISLQSTGSAIKIIPDSELVYGPMSILFDTGAVIKKYDGYLANYKEEVEGRNLDSEQIIELVSRDYSVNPRLLLALLEYQSDWLTNSQPDAVGLDYPMGFRDNWHIGLYRQLTWAANTLNMGYYLWKVNALHSVILFDGSVVPLAPTINSGTAAIQYFFSQLEDYSDWQYDISKEGFFQFFTNLFGYPFDFSIEPLVPEKLIQPEMSLPFEKNQVWAFTGGPHGGWDSGSAWAALDFAPPGEAQGCVPSSAWVTAVADGLIVRSFNGAVIQDLDGDGFEQTGWSVLYMHIDQVERVVEGRYLKTGDRIGHPSCEGGISNGTHVHLARKFNGEWIPADGTVPFDLEGWISSGNGIEYDGFLSKSDQLVEAFDGNNPINQIQR